MTVPSLAPFPGDTRQFLWWAIAPYPHFPRTADELSTFVPSIPRYQLSERAGLARADGSVTIRKQPSGKWFAVVRSGLAESSVKRFRDSL